MATTPKARKLTIAQATEQWVETTRAIEGLKGLQEEAANFLIEHGKKTGKRTFGDRIAMQSTGGQLLLDQPKVREFLGERLADFQKRAKLGWTLKLLK